MIRRKGVLILIFTIMYALLYNNNLKTNYSANREIKTSGVITSMKRKKYFLEYRLGDVLVIDKNIKNKRVELGDKIEIKGIEKKIDSYKVKKFDYGRYLKSKGIKRVVYLKEYKFLGENSFYKIIAEIKQYVKNTNRYLYKEYSAFLNAILTGDKSDIDKKTSYIFMDSGTSHIMAISGLHVTIMLGIAVLLLGGINTTRKFLYVLLFLFFYSEFTDNSPSVIRAVDLFIFSYIGFFIDERVDILNIISIIASTMIFQNTYIIYNLSFQMSFLSVCSIVIFKKYIDKIIYGKFLSTTTSVMIGILPLLVYNFQETSLLGFLGNIIAIPFTALIMLFDLLSLLAYFIFPEVGIFVSFINKGFISFMLIFLKKVGNFGISNLVIKDLNTKYIFLYYVILIVINTYIYFFMIKKERYIGSK